MILASISEIDGRCLDKPDGEYPMRNVFQYLVCKDGNEEHHDCPEDEFFSQDNNTCISAEGGNKGEQQNAYNVCLKDFRLVTSRFSINSEIIDVISY